MDSSYDSVAEEEEETYNCCRSSAAAAACASEGEDVVAAAVGKRKRRPARASRRPHSLGSALPVTTEGGVAVHRREAADLHRRGRGQRQSCRPDPATTATPSSSAPTCDSPDLVIEGAGGGDGG